LTIPPLICRLLTSKQKITTAIRTSLTIILLIFHFMFLKPKHNQKKNTMFSANWNSHPTVNCCAENLQGSNPQIQLQIFLSQYLRTFLFKSVMRSKQNSAVIMPETNRLCRQGNGHDHSRMQKKKKYQQLTPSCTPAGRLMKGCL